MRPCIWLSALFLLSGCAPPPPPKVTRPADSKRRQITVGSTLDCGKLTTQVRPVYPKEAKKKRIQGTVHLRVLITKTGELRNIEVLKGDPQLIPAALKAVKQWRYTPCLIDSEPVEIITVIDIDFNLNQ